MIDKTVWVVIPMYRHEDLTDACVERTLECAGIPVKILVVDDCSDEPYKVKQSEGVHCLRLKERSGFTKAVNAGIRAVHGLFDYVVLLNNDTVPEHDFIKSMVETAEKDAQTGIVGASRIMSRIPYKVAMWGADLVTGSVACSMEDLAEPCQAIWIPFCCVLLTKVCVQYVGLLDEQMVNHCSDNDYCLRAVMMHFGIVFDPNARVFHYLSQTVNELGITPYDDQIYFGRKWFGSAMNEILDKIPINESLNKWGKCGFKYEKRERDLSESMVNE